MLSDWITRIENKVSDLENQTYRLEQEIVELTETIEYLMSLSEENASQETPE